MSLDRLNALRKRVPFWWWLVYDALIALAIGSLLTGDGRQVGLALALLPFLIFSLCLDAIEFVVKRSTT